MKKLFFKNVTLLIIIMSFSLSGCGEAVEITPLRFNPPVWQDGERSIYTITDLDNQFAGTMEIELLASGTNDSPGWTLNRVINSSTKEIVTVVVNERLRPQSAQLERVDPTGRELVQTTYAGSQTDIKLTNKRDQATYERVSLPSDAYDQRTVLPFVRLLSLEREYATQLNSFLPITGRLERVEVRVVGQETITVPAGSFDTWKLNLTSPLAETEAWIGVEPPFPLVKFIDSRNRGTFELQELVNK